MEELKTLISQSQAGDLEAYGSIVRRFQDMAVGYAYSILGDFHWAQDAAQEAFIEAYRNLYQLREPAAFAAWLRRIIIKYCDRFTRGKRVETVSLEEAMEVSANEKDPAQAVEEREMKDTVLAAIRALPQHERIVTTLFYIDGYSHKEIAGFLEIPATTVNSRLQSARRRLQEGMMKMVRDNLQKERPSRDDRFASSVQLFSAVETGQKAKVAELLDSVPSLVNARNQVGQALLHVAVFHGQEETVELLMERGADVKATDSVGRTPLHQAALRCRSFGMADMLLSRDADLNAKDKYGNTPLFLAAERIQTSFWYDCLTSFLYSKGAALDIFTASILNKGQEVAAMLKAGPTLASARQKGGYFPDDSTPLHHALCHGNVPVVQVLLEHGADPNARDSQGRTPIYLATRYAGIINLLFPSYLEPRHTEAARLLLESGAEWDIFAASLLDRADVIEQLLEADPGLICTQDLNGNTPLHLAAWHGKKNAVELLLARGADIDAQNENGETPVALAITYWDEDNWQENVVDLLIKSGCKLDIFTAAALGKRGRAAELIEQDPTLANARNHDGQTPLQLAAQNGHDETVNLLIEHGAELDIFTSIRLSRSEQVIHLLDADETLINVRDEDGLTPLHLAAQHGHLKLARFLIDHGASVDARDLMGATPLHRAIYEGHTHVVRLLLDRGANVHARDNEGNAPLDAAINPISKGETVNLLLSRGADVNTRNNMHLTPLHEAAFTRRVDLMELLLEHGADINARDMSGGTPLGMAVGRGFEDGAEYLLKNGAECDIFSAVRLGLIDEMAARLREEPERLNAKDRHGRTLLLLAVRQEPPQQEAAAFLLEQGAEMDVFTAAILGEREKLAALLDEDPGLANAYDNDRTPMHFAAERGHLDVVKLLYERGADVNPAPNWDIVPLVFERAANIDIYWNWKNTPLHLAAREGHADVVDFLLKHGADVNAQNADGQTPVQCAVEGGHEEAASLLH